MWLRVKEALSKICKNEKGGIDTYIATTICLFILMCFLAASFLLADLVAKYNTLQRTADMVVDDLKTYGGYTRITHESLRNFLSDRSISIDDVTVYLTRTDNDSPLGANPYVYGESIRATLVYEFPVNLVGINSSYQMVVGSTAISQFVDGAVPEQCYISSAGGIAVANESPNCTQWTTPNNGGTDFLWE